MLWKNLKNDFCKVLWIKVGWQILERRVFFFLSLLSLRTHVLTKIRKLMCVHVVKASTCAFGKDCSSKQWCFPDLARCHQNPNLPANQTFKVIYAFMTAGLYLDARVLHAKNALLRAINWRLTLSCKIHDCYHRYLA